MDEFPSNSNRPKKEVREEPPDQKLAKVIEGDVIRRKKSLGKRFREMIVGDESTSVSEYLLLEVIIPNIKDMIFDVATMGVERKLYGEVRSPSRRRGGNAGGLGHVRYDRMSLSGRREERPQLSRQARARHDFDEFVIPSRPEAVIILDSMYDLLDRYEQVTVSNLYELMGESSNFTDERYGWTDLRGSSIRRVRDGYLLDLPRTEVLER